MSRSHPLLNAAGAVLLPKKQAAAERQAAAAPAAPDNSAAAAVANAGAAVASAGAAIAKTSSDEHGEKDSGGDNHRNGDVPSPKSKELVAVEHNGKLAKVVEVGGDEDAGVPKAKVVNVDDDDLDIGQHAPRRRVHLAPDDDRRPSSRLETVADDAERAPSVIVDGRGRFRIPDDQLAQPKERRVTGRTEITEITTTKSVAPDLGSSSADRAAAKASPSSGNVTNSTQTPGVVVNVGGVASLQPSPSSSSRGSSWLLIGMLAGFAVAVLAIVFVAVRRIRAAP